MVDVLAVESLFKVKVQTIDLTQAQSKVLKK